MHRIPPQSQLAVFLAIWTVVNLLKSSITFIGVVITTTDQDYNALYDLSANNSFNHLSIYPAQCHALKTNKTLKT